MLRGINVSGQKMIKMPELKKVFENLRFKNVGTYIQSGNVVFEYKKTSETKLNELIEKEIKQHFGYNVSVIIRTPEELIKIISRNPFMKLAEDENKLYFVFLDKNPDKERLERLMSLDFSPEKFQISEREIYHLCPNGYGKAKLNNNVFEQKLKVIATTRNLKTVRELVRLSKVISSHSSE